MKTQSRYTYQKPVNTPTLQCVVSVFAKVATGGSMDNPRYSISKINLEFTGNGEGSERWYEMIEPCGKTWYCQRRDMIRLFPLLGVK